MRRHIDSDGAWPPGASQRCLQMYFPEPVPNEVIGLLGYWGRIDWLTN